MKKTSAALLTAALAFFACSATAAADRGTKEEAEAMVKRAIAYIKKNGKEVAFAEFSKPNGRFVDRDLYITVTDLNGVNRSHINSRMVGKNLIEMRDPDGKPMVRERVELAKKQSSGWQEYKFVHPQTQRIERKLLYWERVDDVIVGCGVYMS